MRSDRENKTRIHTRDSKLVLSIHHIVCSYKVALCLFLASAYPLSFLSPAIADQHEKRRIFIVSSYDRSYLWSQSTHAGVMAAMLRYGYLDYAEQGDKFFETDRLKTSRTVLAKSWEV